MRHAAHDEVAHVIQEQPGRLRRAGANTVLAILAASALSPAAVEVFGGGSLVGAIANLAGGVGSGYLTTLVTNVATRLRGTGDDLAEARELLAAELQTRMDDYLAPRARISVSTVETRLTRLSRQLDLGPIDIPTPRHLAENAGRKGLAAQLSHLT